MSLNHKPPSCRSLNIYRLVVAKGQKQQQVAQDFGISPPRVSQIVQRVRGWVDHGLGDWLFPGRHDLRFLAALQTEQIRIEESDADPDSVRIIGPGFTYTRTPTRSVSEGLPTERTRSVSEG